MERKNKFIIFFSIVAMLVLIIEVSFAYFSAIITGTEIAITISLTA